MKLLDKESSSEPIVLNAFHLFHLLLAFQQAYTWISGIIKFIALFLWLFQFV